MKEQKKQITVHSRKLALLVVDRIRCPEVVSSCVLFRLFAGRSDNTIVGFGKYTVTFHLLLS